MRRIAKILEKISQTSSRKEKEFLLSNADEDFKAILEYVYNPYKVFGIGKKSLSAPSNGTIYNTDVQAMLDILKYLETNNTGDSETIKIVANFISNFDENVRVWVERIILKDLKIGVGVSTINKVFPNLIPEHKVTLLSKYEDNIDKVEGEEFILTIKEDGVRAECFIGDSINPNPTIITRQGKQVLGCSDLEDSLRRLAYTDLQNHVISGELLSSKPSKNHKEMYKNTMKEVSRNGINKSVYLYAFDITTKDCFNKGFDPTPYCRRRYRLSDLSLISNISVSEQLYKGTNTNKIPQLLESIKDCGGEGMVLNLLNAPYECKRTKNVLKVKVREDCDLRVLNLVEGTGKYTSMLGAFIVEYKNSSVLVGSGFTDRERKAMWENRDFYIGKIICVEHYGETHNKLGIFSLRHPIFKGVRMDKTEPSYN